VRQGRLHTGSLASAAIVASVWLLFPVQALARALVRFVHGVPGVGRATLAIDGRTVGSLAFAQVSSWHSLRSGRFTWTLSRGGTRLAAGTATVGSGAYDVVILERSGTVFLGMYPTQGGRSGQSLVRVIHGAPEFGSPALSIDGHTAVASLGYTQATPYVALTPGTHRLAAVRPGTSTSLLSATVTLRPDVAYSAIVLGTRGEQVRVVQVVDRGAPLVRRVTRAAHHHLGHRGASGATAGASSTSGASATSGASPTSGGSFVVARGDSLWRIARHLAGPGASDAQVEAKVLAIWDRNAARIGTGDPNLIFPGTRLSLP
jgi:hypothetical protein